MGVATKEKSLQVLEKELDLVFGQFIAFRDYHAGWKCFVCGARISSKGNGEVGHFIRRQHMATRYNEYNCNFICFDCNRDDPEHEKKYRIELLRVHGKAIVEMLERKKVSLQKFMPFEIREMIEHYKSEVSKLKRLKGL